MAISETTVKRARSVFLPVARAPDLTAIRRAIRQTDALRHTLLISLVKRRECDASCSSLCSKRRTDADGRGQCQNEASALSVRPSIVVVVVEAEETRSCGNYSRCGHKKGEIRGLDMCTDKRMMIHRLSQPPKHRSLFSPLTVLR